MPAEQIHPEQYREIRGTAFDLRLCRSNRLIHVRADQTALEALEVAGIFVPYSCREGMCGTCETRVIAGRPDHRDEVLTDEEKAESKTMMLCVSRSLDPVLEIDL